VLDGTTGNLYTADPSAHVWNINGTPTLFVYASHDMEQAAGCDRMDRYHVFSTVDMVNWTDYGEIMDASDVPWHNGTFQNNSKFMWAPDCVYKNGKYYFYFPHPSKNEADNDWGDNWQVGIATSDFPASDFTILPQPLSGLNNGSEHQIDPCVFVDDDGQAYIYNGGGGTCFGGRLKENMIEVDGNMQSMAGLVNFHEATWIHKYNGKYYLSYSDNSGGGANNGDQLKYAVSDSPLGPWTDKGVFLYATGCGTSHGSIVQFNGHWYSFYHTDYISNNGESGRSVHFDELFYNPDGSIQVVKNWGDAYNGPHNVAEVQGTATVALTLQAEDFNSGGETYGYHDRKSHQTNNTNYRTVAGVVIENRNNGYTIGDIEAKEFLRYTINAAKAGLYDIDVLAASANANGTFHLNINGVNRSGTISVPNTGEWGTFQTVAVTNIPLKQGENLFSIYVENGGFNIDKFDFRNSAPYSGTPFKDNNVPGKIEAEDFDIGGKNVAWFDNDDANQSNSDYRQGEGVDLEQEAGGGIHISWTGNGEWVKYTLNVTESGIYDVAIRVSTGNGSSGSLSLTFDDVDEYPLISATTASWTTYTEVALSNVTLMQGTHVMKMTVGGNINVDWYNFEKKSDIPTNANSNVEENKLILYPNPTADFVYLKNIADKAEILVFDILGKKIMQTNDAKIDFSSFATGIYFIKVNNQTSKVIRK
ncbi:MAG: family 43 glycosylhydrolase, partial [Prevotellaceae bacterium]|nr:family 43 glycosylhydrolase [Prevotellaceae bacterium]